MVVWDEGENSLEDGTVIGALSVGEPDAIRARTQTLRDVGATRSKFHGPLRDVCSCTIVCIILGCRPAAGVAELCVFNLRSAFVCFTRLGTLRTNSLHSPRTGRRSAVANTERPQPFTREYEFPGREFLIFVSPISYSDVWYHLLSHKPELRDSCCWTDSYCVDDVAASWPGLSFRRVFIL